jgi:hypothetical protein
VKRRPDQVTLEALPLYMSKENVDVGKLRRGGKISRRRKDMCG